MLYEARIRELCGVTKEGDERTDERIFLWFSHIERTGIIKTSKTVYMGNVWKVS